MERGHALRQKIAEVKKNQEDKIRLEMFNKRVEFNKTFLQNLSPEKSSMKKKNQGKNKGNNSNFRI